MFDMSDIRRHGNMQGGIASTAVFIIVFGYCFFLRYYFCCSITYAISATSASTSTASTAISMLSSLDIWL